MKNPIQHSNSLPREHRSLFLQRGRRSVALVLVASAALMLGFTVMAAQDPESGVSNSPQANHYFTNEAPPAPQTHLRIGNPVVYQAFTPCRVLDTRNAIGTYGGPKLVAGATRNFSIATSGGSCISTLPDGVTAVSINVTLVNEDSAGFATVFAGGATRPLAATVNAPAANTVVNNGVIVPLGASGSVDVFVSMNTHMVVDITGYFFNTFETGDQLAISGNVDAGAVLEVTTTSTSANSNTFAIRGNGEAVGTTPSPTTGGVVGSSAGGVGVYGRSTGGVGTGVRGFSGGTGPAGIFSGNVNVSGTLTKGAGSFKIDHPLDPANKYLSHSFVESPDMMNIYNGTITTDGKGQATVAMPDYFTALNREFRYQLTVVGEEFAQALVASEMKDNKFVIKTSIPNVKISWQVTGVRHDAFADAHRIAVVEEKQGVERGAYIHPELFNQPLEKSVDYAHNPALVADEISSTRTSEADRAKTSGSGGR